MEAYGDQVQAKDWCEEWVGSSLTRRLLDRDIQMYILKFQGVRLWQAPRHSSLSGETVRLSASRRRYSNSAICGRGKSSKFGGKKDTSGSSRLAKSQHQNSWA